MSIRFGEASTQRYSRSKEEIFVKDVWFDMQQIWEFEIDLFRCTR